MDFDHWNLEFNEEQQTFHHNHGRHQPYARGWVTVLEKSTWDEDLAIDAYLEIKHPGRKTTSQVLYSARLVRKWLKNLDDMGLELTFKRK